MGSYGVAAGICLGAGAATVVGGLAVYVPNLLSEQTSASRSAVLGCSLALAAGVMLYVSFIEIFSKAAEGFEEFELNDAAISGLTTLCFFAGMAITALIEVCPAPSARAAHMPASHTVARPAQIVVHSMHNRQAAARMQSFEISDIALDSSSRVRVAEVELGQRTTPQSRSSSATTVHAGAQSSPRMSPARPREGEALVTDPIEQRRLVRMGMVTAVAIALHNFPEGLAVFAAAMDSPSVGAVVGLGIALHNIPEGIAVAMPIYFATGSRRRALLWAVLSGATEPIGGMLGYAALTAVFSEKARPPPGIINLTPAFTCSRLPQVLGIVFAIVGGMMVFLAIHELLPTAHRCMPERTPLVSLFVVIGMVIMASSLVIFESLGI